MTLPEPVTVDRQALVTSLDGSMLAMNTSEGIIVQTVKGRRLFPVPFVIKSMIILGGKIYLGNYEGFVVLDPATGDVTPFKPESGEQNPLWRVSETELVRIYQDQGYGGPLPCWMARLPVSGDLYVESAHTGTWYDGIEPFAEGVRLRSIDGEVDEELCDDSCGGCVSPSGDRIIMAQLAEFDTLHFFVYDLKSRHLTSYNLWNLDGVAYNLYNLMDYAWCLNDEAIVGGHRDHDFFLFELNEKRIYKLKFEPAASSYPIAVYQGRYFAYHPERNLVKFVDLTTVERLPAGEVLS